MPGNVLCATTSYTTPRRGFGLAVQAKSILEAQRVQVCAWPNSGVLEGVGRGSGISWMHFFVSETTCLTFFAGRDYKPAASNLGTLRP